MIRDPFYREIESRLAGPLHDETFERCAQDLLSRIYPSLVPVRGGRDGGMDGVTADLEDGPIVLVATIGERVKRNLESSLNSMLGNAIPCRRVISATSQSLSPENQLALRETATDLGFQLVQIYERAAIADLLYRNPKWCRELLDLTGDPSPLSVVARSGRPMITGSVVGRDEDVRWLSEADDDRLVVGQPGSGKTFLLSAIAKQKGWLFVETQDPGQVANGIRSQQPTALIVDDAHVNPSWLSELIRVMTEIDERIPIIATCWPGERDHIIQLLNLVNRQVRELNRLTRPEVARILESAGLTGPERLVYEILNQAEGHPGLAITLAHICIKGDESDLEQVMRGNALVRSVRSTFEPLVGEHVLDVLGALAVGGRAGMKLEVVAKHLGKSLLEIRLIVTRLSAGGVVYDVDGQHLSVRPTELQYALIREVFFSGAASLDINPLLDNVPFLCQSAEVLTNACHRGALIPSGFLHPLLAIAGSQAAWEAYAWLGHDQSAFVLNEHPGSVGSLSHPTLHHAPEVAIPLLLATVTGNGRGLQTDSALRQIEDWIKKGWPGTGDAMKRRKTLLDAAETWIDSGGNPKVGIHAMSIALTPGFRSSSSDPILGTNVTFRFGVLTLQEIQEIEGFWPRVVARLNAIEDAPWHQIVNVVSDWGYPQRHDQRQLPDDLFKRMRKVAGMMLEDIVKVGNASPGLMHRAKELARNLNVELEVTTNAEFETLFPTVTADWSSHRASQNQALGKLAERWASDAPQTVLQRIEKLESEAQAIGERNRQTPWLAEELAERVSSPSDWIEAILDARSCGDLVAPFLLKAWKMNSPDFEAAALQCLSQESSRRATASIIVTIEDPPEKVLENALQALDGMSNHVEALCMTQAVPSRTIQRLFKHENDGIASHAAIGVWLADPKGSVPEFLSDEWAVAILRGNRREYWIGEIFKNRSDLSFAFLRKEIRSTPELVWSWDDPGIRQALRSTTVDQRRQLIHDLPDDCFMGDGVAMLIGEDTDLYRELLSIQRLKTFHLDPVRGRPNQAKWREKAKAALDAGVLPEHVAAASFSTNISWRGSASELWNDWKKAFEEIETDSDERLRHVAHHGLNIAHSYCEDAISRERADDTYRRP